MNARENLAAEKRGSAPPAAEQRRSARIRLQVPLFVRGSDVYGEEFLELAKTLDISANGAFMASCHPLRADEIVTLTIPAPSVSSSGLIPTGMPPIQAKVRRQRKAGDAHLIGLEFLKPLD